MSRASGAEGDYTHDGIRPQLSSVIHLARELGCYCAAAAIEATAKSQVAVAVAAAAVKVGETASTFCLFAHRVHHMHSSLPREEERRE
jgi:hypothetical protein